MKKKLNIFRWWSNVHCIIITVFVLFFREYLNQVFWSIITLSTVFFNIYAYIIIKNPLSKPDRSNVESQSNILSEFDLEKINKKLNICRWWFNINWLILFVFIYYFPEYVYEKGWLMYVLSTSFFSSYIIGITKKLPREDNTSKPLEQGSKQG
ncbi:hypothetical protein [Filifactor villosus]|uniref:Uncharacterized protein n=1 Tax=Filifactor villosus TaxID=29374 RepID=A0ABV9QKP9_9FIRM